MNRAVVNEYGEYGGIYEKGINCFFSILLTALFLIPASAADQSESIDVKYTTLKEIINHLPTENRIGSTEFRELSTKASEYLEGFGIDTDSVGEVYYEIDPDGILVLKALTLMDDGSVRISTFTDYGQDENGNYGRLDHTDLIDQIRSISWSYKNYYGSVDHNNQVMFYYNVYAYQATIYIQGENRKCLRPYQSSMSFSYKQNNVTITNYNGNTSISGDLRYSNGTLISSNFTWATAYNIPSPSAGTTYNRYNYLYDDEVLDVEHFSNPYHNATFKLNGYSRQVSATLY